MAHAQEPSLDVIPQDLTDPGGSADLGRYWPAPSHHSLPDDNSEAKPALAPPPLADDSARATARAEPALIVELDGVLLKSNPAIEAFFSLLGAQPARALAAVATLRHGWAAFKARLAEETTPDLTLLPWNEELLSLLVSEKARGRRIYLASAADRRLVEAVASHFGLFDGVFSSDGTVNLTRHARSVALTKAFGEAGFDYVGAGDFVGGVRTPARRPALRTYLKAIRVHQWLKNGLLVVPMLAAKHFGTEELVNCALAFVSFSLCASSVYVMNDLVDLARDRAHASKRMRPFASGRLPLSHGLIIAPLFLVIAAGLAVLVGAKFSLVLAVYLVINIAYSLAIKRQMIIDVVTLACLYGLRLLAGGAATSTKLSEWLATFAIFIFVSLALVKRCTELEAKLAAHAGDPPGRGYRLADLPMLKMLAATTGMASILVFTLYLSSKTVASLYVHPQWLVAVDVVLIYWVARTLLLAHRGEMHDDPLVFATTDRISLACAAVVLFVMALASV
jgi:4-hydroxybenzoate polyprenyltransferase/beta-phosphoglucomutase-like phosphatase (HAD superfamily)